jgi:hypothetical protein
MLIGSFRFLPSLERTIAVEFGGILVDVCILKSGFYSSICTDSRWYLDGTVGGVESERRTGCNLTADHDL